MNTLIKASLQWARSAPLAEGSLPKNQEHHGQLLGVYAERLKCSRSVPRDDLRELFAKLLADFENRLTDDDTPVLSIEAEKIVFRPLEMEPGRHRETQCACFSALVRHWSTSEDGFDNLVIDLTHLTPRLITRIMRDVSVEDVIRGIRIWETIPCRIDHITVHRPSKMRFLGWTVEGIVSHCLSSKVRRKLFFTNEPYNHISKQRQSEVDPNPVDVLMGNGN